LKAETVRVTCEAIGDYWVQQQIQAAAFVQKEREAAEQVESAPGELVVEVDGVMVRFLDGWHEVKVGVVGGQVEGKLVSPSYLGRRSTAEAFAPLLVAEAARRGALEVVERIGAVTRRGLYILRKVTVLGDGAVWIWNLAEENFGERVEIVDFYHPTEYIWDIANALYGKASLQAECWADTQVKALHDYGPEPVLAALAEAAKTPQLATEQRELLRKTRGYFRNNAARMDYPRFRELGLPIGSGVVESAGRHFVQLRLKRPGSRWSTKGADAILALRARLLSNRTALPSAIKQAA
jgi:hypothetical protein